MKHHHTIETHEEIQGNRPRHGDVSSWARGRTLPAIPTSKKLETAPALQLRAPTRDSLAAALYRRQRIEKRLASEHEKQIAEGLREARAIAHYKSKEALEKTPTQKVSEFFDKLYAANIARTRELNASKAAKHAP